MSKGKRKDSPNDDLVEAAEYFLPHILMFYKRFEDKRPVMLLDLPSQNWGFAIRLATASK
jgi:hypothetical protein